MIENSEIHDKIIRIIQEKGPSLPIRISKQIGMSSLFISAFLAELTESKKVKMSNLKVGGSKLYHLPGQEEQLENFHKYLHTKEIEAFLLLKKKGILRDSEQEPAIRVALRSIRDFSRGFKHNNEIFWRYLTLSEQEAIDKIDKKVKNPKEEKTILKPSQKTTTKTPKKQEEEFKNPLAKSDKKPKKEKAKSEFVQRIVEILNKRYQIIEEKDYKAKEYNCITEVKSELGVINFFTRAKDKKIISETDVKKLLSEAQSIPLPALIIYTGNLSKKAEEYISKYLSIFKSKKLSQSKQ